MSSICIKKVGGATRLFKCCGGLIRPQYEYDGDDRYVPFKYKSDRDCLHDAKFIEWCKKNKKAQYILLDIDRSDELFDYSLLYGDFIEWCNKNNKMESLEKIDDGKYKLKDKDLYYEYKKDYVKHHWGRGFKLDRLETEKNGTIFIIYLEEDVSEYDDVKSLKRDCMYW